jgi:methionyl-tRNA formyltransferase
MLGDKNCRIYRASMVEPLSVSSQTTSDGSSLEITGTHSQTTATTTAVGSFSSDGKKYLHFHCTDGLLAVEELQLEGKKRMGVEEFLRGYRLQ